MIRLLVLGLVLMCVTVLVAAAEPNYQPGQLWTIKHEAGSGQYEYTLLDRPVRDYAYICTSTKELHLNEHQYIMFAIEGLLVYLIDLDGKTQTLTFARKERLQPPPPPIH